MDVKTGECKDGMAGQIDRPIEKKMHEELIIGLDCLIA